MHLKVSHRFGDPKKITQAVANFIYGSRLHSMSIGLEGEKRFGSPYDSHHPDKVNFVMPWHGDHFTRVQNNIVVPKSL